MNGLHAQRYSAVLLAVPAPQAVPLLQPVAPIGAAVAASARMRGSWAVMVRCPGLTQISPPSLSRRGLTPSAPA